MEKTFAEAINFRHACKVFDDSKTISDEKNFNWTAKQTYIASANMMTAGAIKGIDSCAIEGYEKEKVEKLLKLDLSKFRLTTIIPFGYRLNSQPKQCRDDLNKIVEFIK